MRVLIDCTQITRIKAGVGVYAQNLIEQLLKRQNGTFQVILLVQDDDPDFIFDPAIVQCVSVPAKFFRILPFRLLLEQLYIPWLAAKLSIDVIHSLHYSFPLLKTSARKVVTIHDLTSHIMPEVHTGFKRRYFRFFIWAASRWIDGLLFVSESTRSDWMNRFPGYSKPGFVARLGKSEAFRPDLNPQMISNTIASHQLIQPYVLYIGTIEPRKNLVRLVSAFALIAREFPDHLLVIAGKKGWMYEELFRTVDQLGLSDRVIFTGFVSEEDKPYLINGADVFAYPSLYEGFGIPVLEALACGIPTLTSRGSSLSEVAGDAALQADPTDTESIANGLRRLIADTELREVLRERSLERAREFDWKDTASKTIEAYQKVQDPNGA